MVQALAVPYFNQKTAAYMQRYFAFVPRGDGTLSLNSSVDGGATWTWQSLGGPPPGVLSVPAATAFFSGNLASDGSQINQFYSFVVASDLSVWVIVSLDDGKTWNWQAQGAPSGASIAGAPDAVSRQAVKPGGPFEQDVYCHVVGSDGQLYVNYSEDNGKTWLWANRGKPTGTKLAAGADNSSHASSIADLDESGDKLYTFAIGDDQNLYANFGDGSTWQWLPLGRPPSGGLSKISNFWPAAVSAASLTGPGTMIFVFVVGLDGHLWAAHRPPGGTGWLWEDRGTPPTGSIGQFRSNALLADEQYGTKRGPGVRWNLYVFALDANIPSPLLTDFTPDAETASWNWQPSSAPTGAVLTGFVGAVASPDRALSDTSLPIYVFVLDIQNDVHLRKWDGAQWTWLDQNGPI
jgi:hypothetical protein